VNSGKESIKTFVRQTLGCTCPEEVFAYINCQSNIKMNDIILDSKINIGNRLLIYIAEVDNQDTAKNNLPLLIDAGKKERDSLKFNRFRLVLATDKLNEVKETAESIFETISKDDKVHLHIVPKDDIPIFS
jgi:hypothetical protein